MPKTVQLIVLDDDPTGIQTIHGCYLVTRWDEPTLREAFQDTHGFFYVLTNTRAHTTSRTREITASVVRNILKVNREFGYTLLFVSRSDSTLRSHFPTEIETILQTAEEHGNDEVDAVFLVPAFFEGGRLTAGDVHYVMQGDKRVPAADTEFARDSVFGYSTSHLPGYIEEKSEGRIRAENVRSISLEMLRDPDPSGLKKFLNGLSDRTWVVVNAESYEDLGRFAKSVLAATASGKRFAFQGAASIVKSLSGIPDKPLLGKDIRRSGGPGLFVAGSHVQKTTAQLVKLLEHPETEAIELDVRTILEAREPVMDRALRTVRSALHSGKTPVVYTSRQELEFPSTDQRLEAGQKLSTFLSTLVRELSCPISYLVAKGGITSHDILVDGLQVTRTRVLGQILPGVPVVSLSGGTSFNGMPYVIFPGNVGDEGALLRVFEVLN